jgi:rod shape-determining protein MreC
VKIRFFWLWLAVSLSGFLVFAFMMVPRWHAIPKAVEHSFSTLMYPLLVLQHRIITPFKNYCIQRNDYASLQELLAKTRKEHDCLVTENIELCAMIDHLQEVQELADFKKRYYDKQGLLAQVLVRNCSEQAQFYLVDRGSNDGVVADMVALYKDCIIGKVIEVYPRYCKILLVTDRLCKVAAVCSRSKALGIYQGMNEEWKSQLEHVSHLSSIEQNDLVLSTGEGLVFPRGFALGRVKRWSRDGLFYQVGVEPLVDVRSLSYCYLVQKGSSLPDPACKLLESVR